MEEFDHLDLLSNRQPNLDDSEHTTWQVVDNMAMESLEGLLGDFEPQDALYEVDQHTTSSAAFDPDLYTLFVSPKTDRDLQNLQNRSTALPPLDDVMGDCVSPASTRDSDDVSNVGALLPSVFCRFLISG